MKTLIFCLLSLLFLTVLAQEQDTMRFEKPPLTQWQLQTDSIKKLNRLTVNNYTRGFFALSDKYGIVGMNTSFLLSKYRKFDMGVGTGFEYYNRGLGLVQQFQVPVYAVFNIYITRVLFVQFEPGMVYPIAGRYDSSDKFFIDDPVKYTRDEFIPAPMINAGFGVFTENNLVFTLFVRNQYSGTVFPIDKRFTTVGISLGGKL